MYLSYLLWSVGKYAFAAGEVDLPNELASVSAGAFTALADDPTKFVLIQVRMYIKKTLSLFLLSVYA